MSASRPTKRGAWPPSGPHRRLLEHLDKVREAEGRRTYAEIASKSNLALSRISEFLTGAAMPSDANIEHVVRAMGGSDDEASTARRLLARCLADHDQRRVGRRTDIGAPRSVSPIPSQHIQQADVLWRDQSGTFTGRRELIADILDFVRGKPSGYVVVRAEAGVGKTALAAHLVQEYGFMYHFTTLAGGKSPASALRNLCAQLIGRYGVSAVPTSAGVQPDDARSLDDFWGVLSSASAVSSKDGALVFVVDGLDEFDFDGQAAAPLGLPGTLPTGVFFILTSRFGAEARLAGIRSPSAWLTIDIEGSSNLSDMHAYVDRITDPRLGDPQLITRIADTDVSLLRHALIDRCGGVWIYLKYVLDEMRDGTRSPEDVARLPSDLVGYYTQNILLWRGDLRDPSATDTWRLITLPLLSALAVMREPLPLQDIVTLAGVERHHASTFLNATARAFLDRDDSGSVKSYAIRHESFRDLLCLNVPATSAPGLSLLADDLAHALNVMHARFVEALAPPEWPSERPWHTCSAYAARNITYHAAACERLDVLLQDAAFLAWASPESVLSNGHTLRSDAARLALRTLYLSAQDWELGSTTHRLGLLNMWATRLGAHQLAADSCTLLGQRWRVSELFSPWPGKRTLTNRHTMALDIGYVNGRTVVACGYWDGKVSVFDADTGAETDDFTCPSRGYVEQIRVVQADSKAVLVAGWGGRRPGVSLRAWDIGSAETLWSVTDEGGIKAIEVVNVAQRCVAVVYLRRNVDGDSTHSTGHDELVMRDIRTGEELWSVKLAADIYFLALGEIGGKGIIALSGVGVFELNDSMQLLGDEVASAMSLIGDGPVALDDSDSPSLLVGVKNRLELIDPLTGATQGASLIVGEDAAWLRALWLGHIGGQKVALVGTLVEGYTTEVEVSLWDLRTRRKVDASRRFESEDVAVAGADHNGRGLVAMGSRGGVEVWEPRLHEPLESMESPLPVLHLSFAHLGGRDVVVAGRGSFGVFGELSIYDLATRDIIGAPIGWPGSAIFSAQVDVVQDRTIGVAGGDDGACMWDLTTGELLAQVPFEDVGVVRAVGLIGNEGKTGAVFVNSDGSIFTYAITPDWRLRPAYTLPSRFGNDWVAIWLGSVGARQVAVITDDEDHLRTYDLLAQKEIGIPVRGAPVANGLTVYNRDGHCVAISCGRDGGVCRSQPLSGDASGEMLQKADDGHLWVAAAGVVHGRAACVAGGRNGVLTVWDVMTGEVLEKNLRGHRGNVQALIMDKVGRIVSGGDDGALVWWDLAP